MDIRPVANPPPPTARADKEAAPAAAAPPVRPQSPAVEPSARVQQPAGIPDAAQLTQALKNINKLLQESMPPQNVEFMIDEDSDRTIVKVVDQKTKEVLRQIPSEEMLALSKALELSPGLLIKQQA